MIKSDTVTKNRSKYIGGSDIPIIMNLSFFKTRRELLEEKAGLKVNEFKGNKYTEYGNIMEPKIREHINEKYVNKFYESYFIGELSPSDEERLNYRCNVDGMSDDRILEIKTTSNIKKELEDYKVYLVQLLFYMANAKKKKGILAVYERTSFEITEDIDVSKLQIFHINIKDYEDLVLEILESVDRFQDDLLKIKENPSITDEELISPLILDKSKRIIELENKLKSFKEIEKELKETKEMLFNAMKKFKVKKWQTTNGVTFSRVDESVTSKEVFDSKKLKESHPRIYKRYLSEKTTTRKGYVRVTFEQKQLDEFKKEK